MDLTLHIYLLKVEKRRLLAMDQIAEVISFSSLKSDNNIGIRTWMLKKEGNQKVFFRKLLQKKVFFPLNVDNPEKNRD